MADIVLLATGRGNGYGGAGNPQGGNARGRSGGRRGREFRWQRRDETLVSLSTRNAIGSISNPTSSSATEVAVSPVELEKKDAPPTERRNLLGSISTLSTSLSTMQLDATRPQSQALEIARRNDLGSSGQQCIIDCNHFTVAIADTIFEYQVKITPDILSRSKLHRIFKCFNEHYKSRLGNQSLGFDEKFAYAGDQLPVNEGTFKIVLDDQGKNETYMVSIKLVPSKSVHQQQKTINVYNAVLKDIASQGRQRPGTMMGKRLYFSDLGKLKRVLRGVRVDLNHQGYKKSYKIRSFTQKAIKDLTFIVSRTGETKSVTDYFRDRYKIELEYQNLPAIQAGTEDKPIYLPLEISTISGEQRYFLHLRETQLANFKRVTVQNPEARKASILKAIISNNYNNNPGFGIRVSEKMVSVKARILDSPTLKYQNGALAIPSQGRWDMGDKNLVEPGTVDYWATLNLSPLTAPVINHFLGEVRNTCETRGMVFSPEPLIEMTTSQPDNFEMALTAIQSKCTRLSKKPIQMLFVILPKTSKKYYGLVKRCCETQLGIISQCFKAQTVKKFKLEYLENISLKINAKVGCRNTELSACSGLDRIRECPTMIVGADVTHVPPGERFGHSIAAVVASTDWPEIMKYKALVSLQPPSQEMIDNLYSISVNEDGIEEHKGMILEHLKCFSTKYRLAPKRIIYFRDGVGDSQFQQLKDREVAQIRKACIYIEPKCPPLLTVVIAQKRHHTRFFPSGASCPRDDNGNVLPGTVVDTDICDPLGCDFYLASHSAIEGTTRPTHYHTLYDENDFTADEIQNLINCLCYTYQRCTRAVSLVPPIYYAHLAAYRARYQNDGGEESHPSASIMKEVQGVMYYI